MFLPVLILSLACDTRDAPQATDLQRDLQQFGIDESDPGRLDAMAARTDNPHEYALECPSHTTVGTIGYGFAEGRTFCTHAIPLDSMLDEDLLHQAETTAWDYCELDVRYLWDACADDCVSRSDIGLCAITESETHWECTYNGAVSCITGKPSDIPSYLCQQVASATAEAEGSVTCQQKAEEEPN